MELLSVWESLAWRAGTRVSFSLPSLSILRYIERTPIISPPSPFSDVYDLLRETLFMDSAIAGEASGYAMGLVMLGTASPKAFEEMIQYAHETQHEKIIRGLAMGIAFLMYGKEEGADEVIAKMLAEKVSFPSPPSVSCLDLSEEWLADLASSFFSTGCHPPIRRYLHHRHGLRRNVKQPSHPKSTRRRRLGRFGRCSTSGRYRPRVYPIQEPEPGSEDCPVAERELQPSRQAGSRARVGDLVCRDWVGGTSLFHFFLSNSLPFVPISDTDAFPVCASCLTGSCRDPRTSIERPR
jgi:hypothetical protein